MSHPVQLIENTNYRTMFKDIQAHTIRHLHSLVTGEKIDAWGRDDAYYMGFFTIRNTKKGTIDKHPSIQAQNAACRFCRKTIASWGKRKAKFSNRGYPPVPDELLTAVHNHVEKCANDWMWKLLSKWSIGKATEQEADAIILWKTKHFLFRKPREYTHYDSWDYPYRYGNPFPRLPRPVTDEFPIHLEVMLELISRKMKQ